MPSMQRSRWSLYLMSLALLGMAVTHGLDARMKIDEHVWYMFGLFCCNIVAALLVMAALLFRPLDWRLWAAASALALLTIAFYVWSRTAGFPQMADHIGDWANADGNASLVCEAIAGGLGWIMARRLRSQRSRLGPAVALSVLLMLLLASSASGSMQMVGQMGEYPDTTRVSATNLRAGTRLVEDTWANVSRFDTTAEAEQLNYSFNSAEDASLGWPGVRHMRKNGARFWGKVLNPRAPQALLWWCQAPEQCTLIGAMYRAQPEAMPPTYGGLIHWHKHGLTGSWMTHLWLTHDLRSALARCVPFAQLATVRGITAQSYKPDIEEDVACGSLEAAAMGMGGMS
jgi:hypothetical protein